MIAGGRIGYTEWTIEDLFTRVKERFAVVESLRDVVILDGPQNLQAEGAPQRIVFVVGDGELRFGAHRGSNDEIGTLTDVCEAHIWGAEEGKDYGQDQCIAAKSIAVELATAAYLEYSGMISGDAISIAQNTHVLKYGEQIVLTIRLKCPIKKVTGKTKLPVGGATTRV
jgi:hypothetical protein